MKTLTWIPFLLFLSTSTAWSQQIREKINLYDIITDAITRDNSSPLIISNAEIVTNNLKYKYLFEFLEMTIPKEKFNTVDERVIVKTPIIFKNCQFDNILFNRLKFEGKVNFLDGRFNGDIEFSSSEFNELTFEDCFLGSIFINNCLFTDHFIAEWNDIDVLKISNSRFKGITKLINDVNQTIEITGCTFYPRGFPCTVVHDSIGYGRQIYDNLQFVIGSIKTKL